MSQKATSEKATSGKATSGKADRWTIGHNTYTHGFSNTVFIEGWSNLCAHIRPLLTNLVTFVLLHVHQRKSHAGNNYNYYPGA